MNLKYQLYTTPPRQILKNDNTTLWHAGLIPAAKIYMSFNESSLHDPNSTQVLSDAILGLMDKDYSLVDDFVSSREEKDTQETNEIKRESDELMDGLDGRMADSNANINSYGQ